MDADYLPPPPAYSEQEFDQKISRATDISIVTSFPRIDQDGWELYDPAAFDNVSTVPSNPMLNSVKNPSSISSSSNYLDTSPDRHPMTQPGNDKSSLDKLPTIVPLRIEKKSQPKYDRLYNSEAGPSSPLPQPAYDESSYEASSRSPVNLFLDEYHDQRVATHEQERTPNSRSASPLSFEGRSSFASASNIESRPRENWQAAIQQNTHYDPYYHMSQPISPRQSLPVEAPRNQIMLQERPASSYSPRPDSIYTPSGPQVQFNPSVAYGKATQSMPTIQRSPAKINARYDPHSFYNSAVSAQMDPTAVRSFQGEVYAAPSYNQSPHLRPVQQPQLYNNDFPPRNLQQFASNTPRQSLWQAPSSRPITNYPIPNTPRHAAADINRFSQYSSDPTRDSMYSTNQNEWYPSR
ncbi:hypothetical protein GALMADRAFT_236054 [Galerina marginata CBS 339.88]|uniref:Uncharacterized protein n=1 Tax=Galerina marginata (strain CBS 339.88) TaxID=685588 RepID=A0A067TUV2_GALM3|nr:hypothetical protein GALMADRAFT_236054 [Galerina marginata CBS 339.88]